MEASPHLHPVKLGVLTNFEDAFEKYGVGWNRQGLFNILANAVRYDVMFSEKYEFTHIFNWKNPYDDQSHVSRPYNSDARSVTRGKNAIAYTLPLEQITSHFSLEEELMGGLDAHDIDSVLVYYCDSLSPDSVRALRGKYGSALLEFDPLKFLDLPNFYQPHKKNLECSPEKAEIGSFYSLLNGVFLYDKAFMESVVIGRETRLTERQNEINSTIDDIDRYFNST